MLGAFFGGVSATPAGLFGSQLGMLQQQMQQQELARRKLIEQVLYPPKRPTVRIIDWRKINAPAMVVLDDGWPPIDSTGAPYIEVPRREGWCSLCREHHLTHCEWDVIEAMAKQREEEDAVAKVQETIDEWLQTEEGKRWSEHGK